jgi:lipopolysaccharide export system protein LptC
MSLAPEEAGNVAVAERRSGLVWRRNRRGAVGIEQYSRFVTRMKLLMPTVAVGLLLMVAVWPRIQTAMERVAVQLPHIDTSAARDLKMVNMRYAGFDKHNRPYTITADVARQHPGKDDMVELEGPKADMTTDNGTWIAVNSYTGLYEPQRQLLDLFGDVEIFQDKGNEFHSDSMHVDMGKSTAESSDPVEGHGPFGSIQAQGFRMDDRGNVIYFIGKSRLILNSDQVKAPN